MSIPELNKVTKLQDECPNSHSFKQEKSDNAPDMDLVEKETVTPGPVTTTKSKDTVVIDINIDNSKDVPHDSVVWTQFGPTYRPLPTPEYPHGLEGFEHPRPKTAQGGYPSAPMGRGGYPTRGRQGHAYPGGGSPAGNQMGYPQGGAPRGGPRGAPGQGGQKQDAPQEEEEGGQDDEEQEEEEEGWQYTPETKNGWVFKIFATVCVMYMVSTIAVCVMEVTLGETFDDDYVGVIAGGVCLFIMLICTILQWRRLGIEPPISLMILAISVPCVSCIGTSLTVFADTYVVIILLFSSAVTAGCLMLLATTKYDFTSWWLYAIVPGISMSLMGVLVLICAFVLEVEMAELELLVFLVNIIQCLIYVFLFQRVLGGAYETYGDDIYAYTATLLFTTVVYVALVLFVLFLRPRRRRRRRRRRLF